MKGFANECGGRNNFGYYDQLAKEIMLRRPCTRKKDIEEVYCWLDKMTDLHRFNIGLGPVESFVSDGNTSGLYTEARNVLKAAVLKNKELDAETLSNILDRLKKQTVIRSLSIKCYIFTDDEEQFDKLLETIRALKTLVFLDLGGCYLTPEQQIKLAETIAKTRIAHMGWPELRIDAATSDAIMEILKDNRTLTVFDSAPKELFRLAQRNRDELLAMFIHPELITEEDEAYAREYSDSINMAFGLEKKKLYEMEKTFLAVIARFKGGDEPDGGNKPDGDKPDDDD